jgi:hypothetical protein
MVMPDRFSRTLFMAKDSSDGAPFAPSCRPTALPDFPRAFQVQCKAEALVGFAYVSV